MIAVLMSLQSFSQSSVALKTNLLYDGLTFTPNLGLEIGLGRRTTLDISGGYNPWNLNGDRNDNKKLVHWLSELEFRYWFCQRFSGLFLGIHLLGSQYNISGHNLPLLLGANSQNYRYDGWAVGGGISLGYQLVLAKRWNLEFNVGFGYAGMRYNKYDCPQCGALIQSNAWRNYWGPTRGGISLMFML